MPSTRDMMMRLRDPGACGKARWRLRAACFQRGSYMIRRSVGFAGYLSTMPNQEVPHATPQNVLSPSPQEARVRVGMRRAAWFFGWVFMLLRVMNWNPYLPMLGVDSSWVYFLHDSWGRGAVFGRDIVFTYGPYGFVATEAFHPRTYGLMLVLQALILTGIVVGLARLARGKGAWWGVIAALWVLTEGLCARVAETVGWAMLWVTLLHGLESNSDDSERRRWHVTVACLLGVCCGLVALVKFTYLVASAGVMGVIGVDAVARRRRVPWECVAFAVSLVVLWLIAGQPLGAVGDFLRWSWETAEGFSPAMGLSGPPRELVFFALASLALAAINAARWWRDRRWWAVLSTAGVLGLCFMVFKAAFVRQDSFHSPTAVGALVAFGITVLLRERRESFAGVRRGITIGFVVLWCGGAAALAASVMSDPRAIMELPTPIRLVRSLYWNAAGVVDAARGSPNLRMRYDAACQKLRDENPLPIAGETTDIYNIQQALLIAYGANRSPRPVPQSYIAYTPRLAELNASHLRGERAPEVIFFNTETLDLRLAAMNDGPSWVEFLRWYDAAPDQAPQDSGDRSRWLRMIRREKPRSLKLESMGTVKITVGAGADLPPSAAGQVMFMTIDLAMTTRGKIENTLIRPPEIQLDLRQRDGFSPRTRFVPGAGRAGFIVSPLVTSPADIALLLASNGAPTKPRANDVVALRLWVEEADRGAYEKEASVTLYRVVVSPE